MLAVRLVAIAAGVVLAGDLAQPPSRQLPRAGFDPPVLVAFTTSIDKYVELHRRLEGAVPTLEVSQDPAEIDRAVKALGALIRRERAGARQGDIFTREAATAFRRTIRECLAGRSVGDLLRALEAERLDDEEAWHGPLPRPRINQPYPAGAAYVAMPASIVCGLPPLPAELRYQLAGRTLLLIDHHANIVVDALTGALPADET